MDALILKGNVFGNKAFRSLFRLNGVLRVGLVSSQENMRELALFLTCVQRKTLLSTSWHIDSGHPGPQKYEKEISLVKAAQSVIFCLADLLTKTGRNLRCFKIHLF